MRRLCPEERYFAWPSHLLPTAPNIYHLDRDPRVVTDDLIAELLGCGRMQVVRLRKAGLDYWWADGLATRVLHMHPSAVWGNWRMRTTLAIVMEDVA